MYPVSIQPIQLQPIQPQIIESPMIESQPVPYRTPETPRVDSPSVADGLRIAMEALNKKWAHSMKDLYVAGLKLGFPTKITNFYKVDDHLYRGAELHPGQVKYLKKLGVKTIINLKDENDTLSKIEEQEAREQGLNYINIPLDSATTPDPESVALFREVTDNYKMAPFYVHCKHGRDRTGIMVALYRVWEHGWDYDRALTDMHQKGYEQIYKPHMNKFLENYCNEYYGRKPQPSA